MLSVLRFTFTKDLKFVVASTRAFAYRIDTQGLATARQSMQTVQLGAGRNTSAHTGTSPLCRSPPTRSLVRTAPLSPRALRVGKSSRSTASSARKPISTSTAATSIDAGRRARRFPYGAGLAPPARLRVLRLLPVTAHRHGRHRPDRGQGVGDDAARSAGALQQRHLPQPHGRAWLR